MRWLAICRCYLPVARLHFMASTLVSSQVVISRVHVRGSQTPAPDHDVSAAALSSDSRAPASAAGTRRRPSRRSCRAWESSNARARSPAMRETVSMQSEAISMHGFGASSIAQARSRARKGACNQRQSAWLAHEDFARVHAIREAISMACSRGSRKGSRPQRRPLASTRGSR